MSRTSIIDSCRSSCSHQDNVQDDTCTYSSSMQDLSVCSRTSRRSYVNKTFTPYQVREIERKNAILMDKILAYERKPVKPKIAPPKQIKNNSAAINRKKDQMRIDWENQILLRKIQSVKPGIKH